MFSWASAADSGSSDSKSKEISILNEKIHDLEAKLEASQRTLTILKSKWVVAESTESASSHAKSSKRALAYWAKVREHVTTTAAIRRRTQQQQQQQQQPRAATGDMKEFLFKLSTQPKIRFLLLLKQELARRDAEEFLHDFISESGLKTLILQCVSLNERYLLNHNEHRHRRQQPSSQQSQQQHRTITPRFWQVVAQLICIDILRTLSNNLTFIDQLVAFAVLTDDNTLVSEAFQPITRFVRRISVCLRFVFLIRLCNSERG
jgi:hypothetical protein